MGNLNKVMLIGKLGSDPEKKITQNGNSVVTVSLATSERFKDKSGNRQEKTEWHRIVLWNQMAELISQYCKKGSQIYVEGKLQTNEWQDKDGNKRYTTEIQAGQMQFLDPPQGQNQGQPKPEQPPGGNPANGPSGNDFIEDDVPF